MCFIFPFTCTCEDTLPQIRYFTGLVYYILHLNNIEQEMTTNTLPNLSEVLLYLMSISSLFIPSTDIQVNIFCRRRDNISFEAYEKRNHKDIDIIINT